MTTKINELIRNQCYETKLLPGPTMPHQSAHAELLNDLDQAMLGLSQLRYTLAVKELNELLSGSSNSDFNSDLMIITPPSLLTPNISDLLESSSSAASDGQTNAIIQLQVSILALQDEIR